MGGIEFESTYGLIMMKTWFRRFRSQFARIFLPTPPDTWDERSYLSANPDVKAAVGNGSLRSGFEHWHRRGRFEGRPITLGVMPKQRGEDGQETSNKVWDEEAYLQQNPDVRAAVDNGILKSGLDHWEQYGRFEGRRLAP